MELVNGFPCFNCTDVELAKKGINPAKPQDDPRSLNYNPNDPGAKPSGFDGNAVTFGGGLIALNGTQSAGHEGSNSSGSGSGPPVQRPGATLDISI